MIQYQGRLTGEAGNPLDTTVDLTFAVYNDSLGSSTLWEEVHSDVAVSGGLFDVLLGETTPIGKTVFNGSKRWLGISIDGGDVLQPMTPIVASAYSLQSQFSDTASYAANARKADTATVALNATGNGWVDGGNEVYLSTIGDSVGIGTVNPRAPLEVQGPMHAIIGESHGSGTAAGVYGSNDSNGFGLMGVGTNGRGVTGMSVTGFGGYFYGPKNYFSSNLGIGTETPTEMLHIYKNSSGGSSFIRIQADHATNWGESGLRIQTPQNTWHFRMDDDANNNMPSGGLGLRSQNLDAEVMTWSENGQVGIGTINPNYPLEVASSGSTLRARCTGGGIGVYASSNSGFGVYSEATKNFMGGLTGFGTSSPTHRVTVNGEVALQKSGETKYHINYYNTGFNICETSVADYRLYIKDGGNVGIGTSNPTAKLHVAGTLHADAFEANAIDRNNIVDEVGVASIMNADPFDLTQTWTAVLTKQVTIPSAGYILALGTADCYLDHDLVGYSAINVALSDQPNSLHGGNMYGLFLADNVAAGFYGITQSFQRLFYAASAGTYTYYMIGNHTFDDDVASVENRQMDLIFLPTAYGSKNGVNSTDPDDNVLTVSVNDAPEMRLAPAGKEIRNSMESSPGFAVTDLLNRIEELTTKMEALESRLQAVEKQK